MDAVTSAGGPAGLHRWWRRQAVASVDHVDVIRKVEDEAVWSPRYLFMTLMSAGIALLGLLLSSPAVVIGAMLISPLMGPILGMGFALAVFDFREFRRAATALALGSAAAILFTAAIVLVSPLQTVTAEIAVRTRPNLFDLLVALFSALAGSYAMIRGRSGTIVGVAIATALMPPLAVVGFGLATWNQAVFGGALLLFITNMVTIALTATVMARLYGFAAHLSPRQSGLQAVLLVIVLAALAVPLALALKQIAWETVASRQIRDAVLQPFTQAARLSQIDIDYDTRPMRVRAVVLTPAFARDANRRVSAALQAQFERPLDLHIDQLRVGGESRSVEGEQIAAAQSADARQRSEAQNEVRERLATMAGVEPSEVTVDPAQRRAMVRAAPLPGAALATYRALEERAAAGLEGWAVALIPPLLDLPSPPFGAGPLDEDAAASVALAAWAARRLGNPVEVTGSETAAAPVADALAAAGVSVRMTGKPGRVSIRWAPPTTVQPGG